MASFKTPIAFFIEYIISTAITIKIVGIILNQNRLWKIDKEGRSYTRKGDEQWESNQSILMLNLILLN